MLMVTAMHCVSKGTPLASDVPWRENLRWENWKPKQLREMNLQIFRYRNNPYVPFMNIRPNDRRYCCLEVWLNLPNRYRKTSDSSMLTSLYMEHQMNRHNNYKLATCVVNSSLVMSKAKTARTCPEDRSCSTLSKNPWAALQICINTKGLKTRRFRFKKSNRPQKQVAPNLSCWLHCGPFKTPSKPTRTSARPGMQNDQKFGS